jgi:multidrug resistance efflux pump
MAPIAEVRVRAGDRVLRGSPLVTIDAREIAANQAHAAASAASAAESAHAAEADVRSAESAWVLARSTHDRIAGLHAKRSATDQELDQVVAALSAADAQRASARSRLTAATAARDAAAAAAEAAMITAAYTVLSAPFDGVVTERRADPGTMATPGTPLLTLEDTSSYRLEIQLDEARAMLVANGQAVDARLDNANNGEWIRTQVAEIGRVDPASHNFIVKVNVPSSPAVHSGLFGRARFAGTARRGLTVPLSALVRRGQLTFVYLVDADSRARLRPVSGGDADSSRVEVLAGLREHDTVVAAPPPSLTDGARVARMTP